MVRDKKICKTEKAETIGKDSMKRNRQASSSNFNTEDNIGNNDQEVSDTQMRDADDTNRQDRNEGVEEHGCDDLYGTPPNESVVCSQYDHDSNLPTANVHEDRPRRDMIGVVSLEEEKGKPKVPIDELNTNGILACLLTCGSQRVNETMYSVVRHLLNSKTCSVCGTPIAGASLPGLTYLKSLVKPSLRSLVAKHDIIELSVDTERAGAKTGIDKYKSLKTAPVLLVKPSEWARIDFSTPSIKKLIWEDVDEMKNVFDSIEATPIVRHRYVFPVDTITKDEYGIEHVDVKDDRLELTLIWDAKIDKMLERYFDEDVTFVDGVACASVKSFKCTDGLVILEPSPCVRKAFVAHVCWIHDGVTMRCRGVCSQLSPKDCIAEGRKWISKGREDGYLPRSG